MARALPLPARFQLREPVARGGRCLERQRASLLVAAIVAGGEEGEDRIADDIEHLAALLHHGAGGAIEIGVEQVEKGIDRELIGKAGRVAEIAVPERRGKPLAIAALDRACEDAAADQGPVKGVERRLGDLVLDGEAEDERERGQHAAHGGDVGVAEALRARVDHEVASPSSDCGCKLGAAEGHDQREIVGEALVLSCTRSGNRAAAGSLSSLSRHSVPPSVSMTKKGHRRNSDPS